MAEQAAVTPTDSSSGRNFWQFLALLGGAFMVWIFLSIDPFGLGAATSQAAERIALRLMSPLYFNEQPAVTVVLIDDDYLEQAGRSWPLSYADQGRLARTLLSYRPDALFLDIVYRHPHGAGDSPDDLLTGLRARRTVRGRPTPVFIAAFAPAAIAPPEDAECISARPSLPAGSTPPDFATSIGVIPELANNEVLAKAYIGWQKCGNRYPLFVGGNPETTSPAFALYLAHCAAPENSAYTGCELARRFAAGAGQADDRQFAPMTVLWGAYPTASQASLYQQGQCQQAAPATGPPGWGNRIEAMLRQAFRSLIGDVEQSADPDIRLPCPAVDVLRASQIPEGFNEQLSPFFENRLVLVGSYLDGLPDIYTSPVNGQVSGVVAHATALDNLMKRDHRYFRDLPSFYGMVLEVVVLAGVVFLLWSGRLPESLKNRWTGGASLLVWLILIGTAVNLGEDFLALKLTVVAVVMDWFKPKAAAQVAALSLAGAMLALALFPLGFVAFNWINIVLAAWGTAELVKSVQQDKAKKDEVEKISLLRYARQQINKTVTA